MNKKSVLLVIAVAVLGILCSLIQSSLSRAGLKQEVSTGVSDVNGTMNVSTALIDENGQFVYGGLECNKQYMLYVTNNSTSYVDGYSAIYAQRNDFSDTNCLVMDINSIDTSGAVGEIKTESFDLFDYWGSNLGDDKRIQINGLAPGQTVSFSICFYYFFDDLEAYPENTGCNIQFELIFLDSKCSQADILNFEQNQFNYWNYGNYYFYY